MATIAIRIRSLAQLFDVLDPAPLQESALERNAEGYILGCAGKHRPTEPLRLLVHLPESLRAHAADASDAIHEHFRRRLGGNVASGRNPAVGALGESLESCHAGAAGVYPDRVCLPA